MKFMLLIYNSPATLEGFSEEERNRLMAEVDDLMAELARSGELVGGDALAQAPQSKTVRIVEGVPVTTDGPFAELKEHLAGYLMVEVESVERAVEIAAKWPDARFGAMEVRQVIDTVDDS